LQGRIHEMWVKSHTKAKLAPPKPLDIACDTVAVEAPVSDWVEELLPLVELPQPESLNLRSFTVEDRTTVTMLRRSAM